MEPIIASFKNSSTAGSSVSFRLISNHQPHSYNPPILHCAHPNIPISKLIRISFPHNGTSTLNNPIPPRHPLHSQWPRQSPLLPCSSIKHGTTFHLPSRSPFYCPSFGVYWVFMPLPIQTPFPYIFLLNSSTTLPTVFRPQLTCHYLQSTLYLFAARNNDRAAMWSTVLGRTAAVLVFRGHGGPWRNVAIYEGVCGGIVAFALGWEVWRGGKVKSV
jgi:hypothetical protein